MRSRDRNIFEAYGNVYFVTSTVVGFIRIFEDEVLCRILLNNLQFYQGRGDFRIIAYVLMPNHFHLIIKMSNPNSVSKCIANFKRMTSRQISQNLEERKMLSMINLLPKAASGESANDAKIWKPRFDCFVINNEPTLLQKIEYIHNNPSKSYLCPDPADWPYSSARNYVGRDDCLIDVDTEWVSLRK